MRLVPQCGQQIHVRRNNSASRRRTAGKLGCGGGPGGLAALLFRPLLETEVLEEAKRDHGHERMAVQAGPGPALEVVEAQLLLHLLVGLLADPSIAAAIDPSPR